MNKFKLYNQKNELISIIWEEDGITLEEARSRDGENTLLYIELKKDNCHFGTINCYGGRVEKQYVIENYDLKEVQA